MRTTNGAGEDYLVAILTLGSERPTVRSIDLARHMGFSRPTISKAVTALRADDLLTVDDDGSLHLTAAGRDVAEDISARREFFTRRLVDAGVDRAVAEREACQLEHVVSRDSFIKLRTAYGG